MAKRRHPHCRGCGRRVGTDRWPAVELTWGPTTVVKPLCTECVHDFMHRLGITLWESGEPEQMADAMKGYASWCAEAGVEPRPCPWDVPDSAPSAG